MTRRQEIEANLNQIREEIESFHPTLIVVTKTYPVSDVEILVELGCNDFGENRSSEGAEKSAVIAANWHFQGQIQSNKIREIASWASVVHSLDSLSHAEKISRARADAPLDVFLQLSLNGDPSRGGVEAKDLSHLASSVISLPGIHLMGIMCVPPVDLPADQAYPAISKIHREFTAEFASAPFLSAGMSGDYRVALDYGATHIRVGSKILGSRTYLK